MGEWVSGRERESARARARARERERQRERERERARARARCRDHLDDTHKEQIPKVWRRTKKGTYIGHPQHLVR